MSKYNSKWLKMLGPRSHWAPIERLRLLFGNEELDDKRIIIMPGGTLKYIYRPNIVIYVPKRS